MKNRTEKEFIHVFQYLHGNLTARGLKPNYMGLYNEASPDFHEGEVHQLPTGPSRNSQMQLRGEGHQHLQGSLHHKTLRDGPRIPNTKLRPPTGASGYHAQPPTTVKVESKTFGLHATKHGILFQPHPHGPSRNKSTGIL